MVRQFGTFVRPGSKIFIVKIRLEMTDGRPGSPSCEGQIISSTFFAVQAEMLRFLAGAASSYVIDKDEPANLAFIRQQKAKICAAPSQVRAIGTAPLKRDPDYGQH